MVGERRQRRPRQRGGKTAEEGEEGESRGRPEAKADGAG